MTIPRLQAAILAVALVGVLTGLLLSGCAEGDARAECRDALPRKVLPACSEISPSEREEVLDEAWEEGEREAEGVIERGESEKWLEEWAEE